MAISIVADAMPTATPIDLPTDHNVTDHNAIQTAVATTTIPTGTHRDVALIVMTVMTADAPAFIHPTTIEAIVATDLITADEDEAMTVAARAVHMTEIRMVDATLATINVVDTTLIGTTDMTDGIDMAEMMTDEIDMAEMMTDGIGMAEMAEEADDMTRMTDMTDEEDAVDEAESKTGKRKLESYSLLMLSLSFARKE
jgi:hypothetical protein